MQTWKINQKLLSQLKIKISQKILQKSQILQNMDQKFLKPMLPSEEDVIQGFKLETKLRGLIKRLLKPISLEISSQKQSQDEENFKNGILIERIEKLEGKFLNDPFQITKSKIEEIELKRLEKTNEVQQQIKDMLKSQKLVKNEFFEFRNEQQQYQGRILEIESQFEEFGRDFEENSQELLKSFQKIEEKYQKNLTIMEEKSSSLIIITEKITTKFKEISSQAIKNQEIFQKINESILDAYKQIQGNSNEISDISGEFQRFSAKFQECEFERAIQENFQRAWEIKQFLLKFFQKGVQIEISTCLNSILPVRQKFQLASYEKRKFSKIQSFSDFGEFQRDIEERVLETQEMGEKVLWAKSQDTEIKKLSFEKSVLKSDQPIFQAYSTQKMKNTPEINQIVEQSEKFDQFGKNEENEKIYAKFKNLRNFVKLHLKNTEKVIKGMQSNIFNVLNKKIRDISFFQSFCDRIQSVDFDKIKQQHLKINVNSDQSKENAKVMMSILEVLFQISMILQTGEKDSKEISLYGVRNISDGGQRIEQRIMNQEKRSLEEQRFILSLDKNCSACAKKDIVRGFKIACLAYNSSDIHYNGEQFSRTNLISKIFKNIQTAQKSLQRHQKPQQKRSNSVNPHKKRPKMRRKFLVKGIRQIQREVDQHFYWDKEGSRVLNKFEM